MTILLVEDYPLLADLLCAVLEDAGFEVAATSDGEHAVDLFERDPLRFSGVVSDVMLPGEVDGGQIAELVRSRRPDLPIILMSGVPTALTPYQNRFRVIDKPFRLVNLLNLLRAAVSPAGEIRAGSRS